MISLLLALALSQPSMPAVMKVKQGTSLDGGVAWTMECINCGRVIVDGGTLTVTTDGRPLQVVVTNQPIAPKRHPLTGAALVDGSATTQPVAAAQLPLPAGAATDATERQILQAVSVQSQQPWAPVPTNAGPAPLNPFLPRCNAVRKSGCQP